MKIEVSLRLVTPTCCSNVGYFVQEQLVPSFCPFCGEGHATNTKRTSPPLVAETEDPITDGFLDRGKHFIKGHLLKTSSDRVTKLVEEVQLIMSVAELSLSDVSRDTGISTSTMHRVLNPAPGKSVRSGAVRLLELWVKQKNVELGGQDAASPEGGDATEEKSSRTEGTG